MSTQFDYLLDKIASARFCDEPFRHLDLSDFLSAEHLRAIITDPQVDVPQASTLTEMFGHLDAAGFETIGFPGCITSREDYAEWLAGNLETKYHGATEGCGMVLRLAHFRSDILKAFHAFVHSNEFVAVLTEKFNITSAVRIDGGIQKYLHGYEISPHPDIRSKALTWMLNLNPHPAADMQDHHTHYMSLRTPWRFISEYWRGNPHVERDWLPWNWCETHKQQRLNNSMVIFSPDNDTLHGVRAHYDHLQGQRTQLYGNLWYDTPDLPKVSYQQFDLAIPVSA